MITANYNGTLKINSSMALEAVYSCYVDGRVKVKIEDLDGTFEVHDDKSLGAYEVVLDM